MAGCRVVLYPSHVGIGAVVVRLPPAGVEETATDQVGDLARERGHDRVVWNVPERPDTEEITRLLTARGARAFQTLGRSSSFRYSPPSDCPSC